MPLKFEISGPIYKYDEETSFQFKRISRNSVYQWELKNSVLKNRSKEERVEFGERASKGVSNWDYFSPEEKADLSSMASRFCFDHIEKIEGVLDESGAPIKYETFSDPEKIRFWDEALTIPTFIDWLEKYKAGGEKKSTTMDENN